MKRRCLVCLLALLMLLGLVPGTLAADRPFPATAYYLEDTLYTFAGLSEYAGDGNLDAGLMVHGVQVGTDQTAQRLSDGEEPIQYLLLIDCSTSMPVYSGRIQALAEALMGPGDASVTIASFGVEFQVLAWKLTDPAEVSAAIDGLAYDEGGTDICGGAVYAVEYAKNYLWEPGELVNIVLITDGEPFYSYDSSVETQSEAAAAAALETALEASPQVLMHSVCFAQWEPVTYQAVSSGAGIQADAWDQSGAYQAGEDILDYSGDVYRLSFPLEEYSDDLSLKLANQSFITIQRVQDLTEPEESGVLDDLPVVIDSETEPEQEPEEPVEGPAVPVESDEPVISEAPAAPEGSEVPAEPEEANVPEPSEEAQVLDNATAEPLPEGEAAGQPTVPTRYLMIGGAILLALILVIVVLIVLLRKRSRNNRGADVPPAANGPAEGGIPIQVAVLYGDIQGGNQRVYLRDHLLVGRDGRCDIVLLDNTAAPVNSRIYFQDGLIYIEDLNSSLGTAIGGMRIYSPNRLRSGDEIIMGNTCISVTF